MKKFLLLFLFLVTSACTSGSVPNQKSSNATLLYNYPINNPYAATIIGVPDEIKADNSIVPDIKERRLTIFPKRRIPEGFWYEKGLRYGEILQDKQAPLVFILAGTGANYRSDTMRSLAQAFYLKGFHVVLLPSSTHTNFIINASENFIPGNPRQSSKDLYRVMKLISNRLLSKKVPVSGYSLTGYSLGAMDAAFAAYLDEAEKSLNFQKVVLINPPFSLYSSIRIIDELLYRSLPDGIDGVDRFIDTEMSRISMLSPSGDALDFQNARLLIEAYSKYPAGDNRLATMVGLAFRIYAANMIFTSDVMARTGYIFPPHIEFTTGTSLNNYLSVALRTSLEDYFEDVYAKRFISANPALTKQALINESSLEAISGYLSQSPKIGLITNEDDIILAEGELDKLRRIFGARTKIFPNGGHLGNLSYTPVTGTIIQFMQNGAMQ